MTNQRPSHDLQKDTDIPQVTEREDEVPGELSDQDLDDVSGGNITFQPSTWIPGNPI